MLAFRLLIIAAFSSATSNLVNNGTRQPPYFIQNSNYKGYTIGLFQINPSTPRPNIHNFRPFTCYAHTKLGHIAVGNSHTVEGNLAQKDIKMKWYSEMRCPALGHTGREKIQNNNG